MWTADLPLADEGSEKHSGVYPPAECGFYSLYKRQGGFEEIGGKSIDLPPYFYISVFLLIIIPTRSGPILDAVTPPI